MDLEKIGGKDWYSWGAELLLVSQKQDGSWSGEYGYADTCFALLFLKRANFAARPERPPQGQAGPELPARRRRWRGAEGKTRQRHDPGQGGRQTADAKEARPSGEAVRSNAWPARWSMPRASNRASCWSSCATARPPVYRGAAFHHYSADRHGKKGRPQGAGRAAGAGRRGKAHGIPRRPRRRNPPRRRVGLCPQGE